MISENLLVSPSKNLKLTEILSQKVLYLENKVNEINESIRYASKIQQAILPPLDLLKSNFEDAFVFYQPKDMLSGDFYWFYKHKNAVYLAVGDCTGHGIPGALVYMAANSFLQQIIKLKYIYDPGQILHKLNLEISSLLNDNRTVGSTYDGVDIALCKFDLENKKGYFSGGGRPMVLIRENQIIEFEKGTSSIGFDGYGQKQFKTHEFDLLKGDSLFLFSDGYTDQFGGEKVKKFNRKRFLTLIQSIAQLDMSKQEKEFKLTFDNWKGKQEQIDDVCVVGVKL